MKSKYAVALYEMLELRRNMDRCIESLTIDRFRELIGRRQRERRPPTAEFDSNRTHGFSAASHSPLPLSVCGTPPSAQAD
jgi:hypothetical protein